MAALTFLMAAASAMATPAQVRVDFDTRRVTSVAAIGLADRATGRAVTADDPVRIASISKLVVAMGVMRLVEAGRLDLDRDVTLWLGWRLRHPAYPDAPVTLRQLLSHRAGLRDDVDYAISLDGSVQATLAAPAAWDARQPPGTGFRYANLNFPVVASVMEAATGERFDRLMARLVLRPLKLDACFNWTTCSDAAVARAVVLYDVDGSVRRDDLSGRRPDCPVLALGGCDLSRYVPGTNGALFSPQGGLRISARDLARLGQVLLRPGKFLKPSSVAALFASAGSADIGETEGGFYCRYGLATQTLATAVEGCRDDPFGDGRERIGHAGEAYGLRSGLWLDRRRGRGVAFFVTAVADDAPKGRSAFTLAEETVLSRAMPTTRR